MVANALLITEITGVIPLPPENATIGVLRGTSVKTPAGRVEREDMALGDLVEHPVRDPPPGHALHGRDELRIGVRRARHRVAPHQVFVTEADAERAELPGLVGKGLLEVGGHVEHERLGVVGLLHDARHGQRVVPVVATHIRRRRA